MKLRGIPYSLVIAYCILNTIFVFNLDTRVNQIQTQVNQMNEQLDTASNLLLIHIRNDNLKKAYDGLLDYKLQLEKTKQKMEFEKSLENNEIKIYPLH
jgi:hypothetical protein